MMKADMCWGRFWVRFLFSCGLAFHLAALAIYWQGAWSGELPRYEEWASLDANHGPWFDTRHGYWLTLSALALMALWPVSLLAIPLSVWLDRSKAGDRTLVEGLASLVIQLIAFLVALNFWYWTID
jgi:hypothetical protein